jgi:hypothetical protein
MGTILVFCLPLLALAVWLGAWGYRRYGYAIWTPAALILAILLFSAISDR